MSTLLAISQNLGFFTRPIIISLVLLGLALGLWRTSLARGARIATWLAVALPLLAWLLVASLLAQSNFYDTFPWARRLVLVVLPPIWLAVLTRSTWIAAVIDAMPPSWLIGMQLYRVLGFAFLVQWAVGRAPAAFALPAGIGDVLTGALALPVALYVAHRAAHWRLAGYAWNLFGLADLAMAVLISIFVFSNEVRFPAALTLIPTFGAPLGVILHGLSLWQLFRTRTAAASREPGERQARPARLAAGT